ncbi:branched-chain amino acid aminotransferase [Amycolatopsis sp. NPDC088138]|uniref:branched-chain amino acid aminotransferase n=1 Tax=Amycolatopsis sp. NPDC088138 TaxID=3363938 RepID=UPI0038208C17
MNRPSTVPETGIPGFGEAFTDHMVTLSWAADTGWTTPKVRPYGDLTVNPAMVGLHYGQVVFEGLKAHRQTDGSIALFRPGMHAHRFQRSARRLAMPELPEDLFRRAAEDLVREDGHHLPDDPALSLYLRPVLFAAEPCLALRPAREYQFVLLAFVTGGFFGTRPEPVPVMVSRRYSRAAPGGTGHAKSAGNYAASYLAQLEAEAAGCKQVVWLDAAERRWVEELGATNLFFVRGSGPDATVVTPTLTGTLLPGITRDSLLVLATDLGYAPAEERVSLDQWRTECRSGVMTESFACGTAAVVTPVGRVHDEEGDWTVGNGEPGDVTVALRDALVAIQRGQAPDLHHWMSTVG